MFNENKKALEKLLHEHMLEIEAESNKLSEEWAKLYAMVVMMKSRHIHHEEIADADFIEKLLDTAHNIGMINASIKATAKISKFVI